MILKLVPSEPNEEFQNVRKRVGVINNQVFPQVGRVIDNLMASFNN